MTNENQNINQDCDQLAELLPAYSLGMTDIEETELVERLLEICPETPDYDALTEAMLFAVPQVEPPAHIRNNLMQLTAPEEDVSENTASDSDILRLSRYFLPLVAGMIAIFGLVGYLVNEINTLREDRRVLLQQLNEQDAFLNQISQNEVLQIPLNAENGDSSGVFVGNTQGNIALLQVENFPPLNMNMTYQAWLIRGEQPVSAGLFDVGADGRATLIINAPQPVGEFDFIGITLEPASGSNAPTTTPIVLGELNIG